jgi:hypothetical protein
MDFPVYFPTYDANESIQRFREAESTKVEPCSESNRFFMNAIGKATYNNRPVKTKIVLAKPLIKNRR